MRPFKTTPQHIHYSSQPVPNLKTKSDNYNDTTFFRKIKTKNARNSLQKSMQ